MLQANRRKGIKWGTPDTMTPEETLYALDMFSYTCKICLLIHSSFQFQYVMVP